MTTLTFALIMWFIVIVLCESKFLLEYLTQKEHERIEKERRKRNEARKLQDTN